MIRIGSVAGLAAKVRAVDEDKMVALCVCGGTEVEVGDGSE